MKATVNDIFEDLLSRYPVLETNMDGIAKAFETIKMSVDNGGKLLIAGNGGSAMDAEHIVGELMKSFVKKRTLSHIFQEKLSMADKVLGKELAVQLQDVVPAISLVSHPALSTAFSNDVNPLLSFAQQLYGFGDERDVFLALSTSGNSKNIIYAAIVARAKGMKIIAMTGKSGGKLAQYADVLINVSETEVFKVQELHLPIYHALCLMLEENYFIE